MNEITFNFEAEQAKPTEEETPKVPVPSQVDDSDEYLCGNSGPVHVYANPGRNQDSSRLDESIPAQGCSRYVS